jgi:hypothetical protein
MTRAPMSRATKSESPPFALTCAIVAYAAFGAAHELAHGLSHIVMSLSASSNAPTRALDIARESLIACVRRAYIVRDVDVLGARGMAIVRACGVMMSLACAVWASKRDGTASRMTPERARAVRIAAWASVFDALCTDVFDILPRRSKGMVLCGNFGVVLINAAWATSANGARAFDVLEKMVNVTMMRGAQSGGVVTFSDHGGDGGLIGERSRVVNMKRTDLSKLVRAKVERESGGRKLARTNITRVFAGHTRFATTSKATFDGTHPHQWSPREKRLVYALEQTSPGAIRVDVENFITHNGDFDFYRVNGRWYDLGDVQKWLELATGHKAPSTVDSAAIAGVIDLLRAQGCFGLAARYAVCFGLKTSEIADDVPFPSYAVFEQIGSYFSNALDETLAQGKVSVRDMACRSATRDLLVDRVVAALEANPHALSGLGKRFIDEEMGASACEFVRVTWNAFFDNDSLFVMKTFLSRAKGSFGLMITNSLDAARQVCVAARGQTMSIAFYPKKGLICYGSEQAAVKAGLSVPTPGGDILASVHGGEYGDDNAAVRLDLDDLNGEICLLDWGADGEPAVSVPNAHCARYSMMGRSVNVVLAKEGDCALKKVLPTSKSTSSKTMVSAELFHRMTRLEGNSLIKPLLPESDDLVLSDIRDIPKILRNLQEDWRNRPQGPVSLNRLTAWNLARCVKKRLQRHAEGTTKSVNSIDFLITGCEVSLWLAEQFASDLQQAFPALNVKALSSNKILGLFGQDIAVPTIGFPSSGKTCDFNDTVVIIVSHSGGTFAPLATSNLLQSSTNSIFVVASEWDTQIGKQLSGMKTSGQFESRIFSTDVGVRPAEPCSVSVAATQQLLTQIFMHVALVVLDNPHYRKLTNAVVAEHDLQELERCNQMNITALERIVGCTANGDVTPDASAERDLRAAGDVWADHVLEGVKGWMMSFAYIVGTVTAGYPLVTGVATACGLAATWAFYVTRFFDSLIYVFLPQISITLLRLAQGRNVRHRMTGRTVVVGDIPWVAQSAEAFLSKIFACSYSAAGINVLSGNPSDHLVHRHTHRVVRGALLVVGRPDGRLSALASAEATTCLSLNQASSIQSYGGTCESMTIGHSPYKLPLSARAVFLDRHRPLFLCEKLVHEREGEKNLDGKSPGSLLGMYATLADEAQDISVHKLTHKNSVALLTDAAMNAKAKSYNLRAVFDEIDVNGDGGLCLDEFKKAYMKVDQSLSEAQITKLFRDADDDNSGELDFDEFVKIMNLPEAEMLGILQASSRNEEGLMMVEPSDEDYFGQSIRRSAPKKVKAYTLVESQAFSMKMYEARIASLQRFVAMTVMFHQMGARVQNFWRRVSFGYLGYRMDRTHSIMRIATTASPVSGAEVRAQMHFIGLVTAFNNAVGVIGRAGKNFAAPATFKRKSSFRRNGSFSPLSGR